MKYYHEVHSLGRFEKEAQHTGFTVRTDQKDEGLRCKKRQKAYVRTNS